jgi:hypothetical protein
MIGSLLLASFLIAAPNVDGIDARCTVIIPAAPSDSLRQVYAAGKSFPDFLAAAKNRKEQWQGNYATGASVDATMVARVNAVQGKWYLLVVAVDGCSDSVSTVPYLARLLEQTPNVEMRIVSPDQAKWVQEAHPTPDGRAATPTMILLDSLWNERGCFIERPEELRTWLKDNDFAKKMDWYASDSGRTTVATMVGVIEAAGRGESVCR